MKKDYHINIFYSDEDEGYIADIPDLEACSAFGETPEKAARLEVQITKGCVAESRQSSRQIHSQTRLSTGDLSIASWDTGKTQGSISMGPDFEAAGNINDWPPECACGKPTQAAVFGVRISCLEPRQGF